MTIVAIICIIVALGSFAWAMRPHPAHPSATNWEAVGLFAVTLALAAQWVIGAEHWHWIIH